MNQRMKRLQRSVSIKQKGSSNRKKTVSKLAKLHARIANIRKDAIHKLTTYLAKNHRIIKIEELSIKAFLKNHKLAGAIADCGMYEFKRQLEYKTEKFSSQLILVDRMFPSSQICSNCGNHRHRMPLKDRIYVCPDCGHTEDRDLNASKNIERWFEGIYIPVRMANATLSLSDQTVSSTEIACGVDKPPSLRHRAKPVSSDSFNRQIEATTKQEVNAETTNVHLSLDLGSFG